MLSVKKRLNFTLTLDLISFLEDEAKRTGLRKSDIVALALIDYKNKVEK